MTDQHADAPEFHIVVRRPNGRGPIAPYRFAITIVMAAMIAGRGLWTALELADGIDMALLRVFGAAVFAWFVLGKIDRIIGSAPPPPRPPANDA